MVLTLQTHKNHLTKRNTGTSSAQASSASMTSTAMEVDPTLNIHVLSSKSDISLHDVNDHERIEPMNIEQEFSPNLNQYSAAISSHQHNDIQTSNQKDICS